MILAVCALIVLISLALSGWTFIRQTQSETIRVADKKAQSIAQVAQCFTSLKTSPQVLAILGIVDILATNSIKANQAAIAADPNSPLTKTRQDSLARLEPARNNLRAFIRRTAENAPTAQTCQTLAGELGVDPSKLVQP